MNFQQRVRAFVRLGHIFENWVAEGHSVITSAGHRNAWFTADQVQNALLSWSFLLKEEQLLQWLGNYDIGQHKPERIAIIMAGNIPLVGFHDLASVLLSGHIALVKLSGDDEILMKAAIQSLIDTEPEMATWIQFVDGRLPQDYHRVIATGSNNTNRYFEYYFRNKPAVLRKNRHSVAVLTGNETPEDIIRLGSDIFTYFGLGCRNVSKLYIPESFDVRNVLDHLEGFSHVSNHHKYANNYAYHRSIFLMNQTAHLDNGFLLLKEDKAIASPLSVLYYETYKDESTLQEMLAAMKDDIQCIVGKTEGFVPYGQSQRPGWMDYADGVDTLNFLLNGGGDRNL